MVLGIAEWLRAPQLRYLRPLHGKGPAAARNRGWRAAKGALIAFTADDAVPSPDWLMAGATAFERNRQWVALSGKVVAATDHSQRATSDSSRVTRAPQFIASNAFVWRTALEAVGGFDERFMQAWREDSDLQFQLLTLGGGVGHCPEAQVTQPV